MNRYPTKTPLPQTSLPVSNVVHNQKTINQKVHYNGIPQPTPPVVVCPPNLKRVRKEKNLLEIFELYKNTLVVILYTITGCEPCEKAKDWYIKFAISNKATFCVYIKTNEYAQVSNFVNENIKAFPTFVFVHNTTILGMFEGFDPINILKTYANAVQQMNISTKTDSVITKSERKEPRQLAEIKSVPEDTQPEVVEAEEEPQQITKQADVRTMTPEMVTKKIIESFSPMACKIPEHVWNGLPKQKQGEIFQKYLRDMHALYKQSQNELVQRERIQTMNKLNKTTV